MYCCTNQLFTQKMGIRRVSRALRPVRTDNRILVLRLSLPGTVVGGGGRQSVWPGVRAKAGGHVARRDQTHYYIVFVHYTFENRLLGNLCFVSLLWFKFNIIAVTF